ncbi:MAG: Holliday junction branch migration protein RuvA [Bacteroidia bacterium]|nr:Holliday junction branch migration protein RuvA [Bacteroidia bacterium]
MYDYIKGNIAQINATQLIIDNNGMGYDVSISLHTYSKLKELTQATIYIHLSIKEDAHLLYGFADMDERWIFRQLITVSGVGANTARMMLSSLTPAELQTAIMQANASLLQRIKGIGNKTAQRIILDLKDKLGKESMRDTAILPAASNSIRNEALSALLVLGFAKAIAEKAIDNVIKNQQPATVEQLIKAALAAL